MHATSTGVDDLLCRCLARDVDDVDRRIHHLGDADRTTRRLGLDRFGTRQCVINRRRLAVGKRLADEVVDDPTVLSVDLHNAADLVRALERLHEEIVGHHQGTLVGKEDLEGRDALVDHRLHVLEGLRVRSGDRHVKAIVDVCGTLGATHPLIERRL